MEKKKLGVVYTCITGGYDELQNHVYNHPDWDYVCFADNFLVKSDVNSSWQIRPLVFEDLDDVRNQRWHKIHAHILFPDYERSIWIDANQNVLNESFFCDIETAIDKLYLIAIAPHPMRNCLYDELDACLKWGKDNSDIMKKQVELIRNDDFPKNQGLFETCIMFRRHKEIKIISLMNDWWWWVKEYSRRDQLSLTYVAWKSGVKIMSLAKDTYRNSEKIRTIYKDTHITKEELLVKTKNLQGEVIKLSDKIVKRDDQIVKRDDEIVKRDDEIVQRNQEIIFMQSSRFWKLRTIYIKLKFLIFSPRSFFKKNYKKIFDLLLRAKHSLKNEGLIKMATRITNFLFFGKGYLDKKNIDSNLNVDYKKWIEINEVWNKSAINIEINNFLFKPKISIIMPVYNVAPKWLNKSVQSVVNQFYENWELCIHDDASTSNETIECLRNWEKKDPRIKISFGLKNQHISGASNESLRIASGEFVAFLDNDDELSPDALFEVVKVLNQHSETDFIYSDEDKMETDGERVDPFFKPDWSPDLFFSLNYLCHFSVIRKKIVDKVGGFRIGYEGAQDFDLFLRCLSETKKIKHITKILYHWRKLDTSTAKSIGSKKYAHESGEKALNDYFINNKINATVSAGYGDTNYRIQYEIPYNKKISIIIPFKDKISVLKKCIDSILKKSTYNNFELILINNNSEEKETFEYLNKIKNNEKIKIFKRNVPFNFSAINNFAVENSMGDFLLFLNNDTEVIAPSWLEEMLMHANRDDVGAVGALLYYPDGTIQHSGVVMGMTGLAGHIFSGQKKENTYYNLANYTRNYSAVTAACLMISRSKFLKVGGFNESFTVCGNDVDLCLKLHEAGLVNICTPYAELFHHESLSRDKQPPKCDIEISQIRYAPYIGKDIYYNPNLSLVSEVININLKK